MCEDAFLDGKWDIGFHGTNRMHSYFVGRTMVSHSRYRIFTTYVTLRIGVRTTLKLERKKKIGRVFDIKWRLHTFFVVISMACDA